MPSKLNIFPVRVPIGAVQPDGTVLMTPEFARALADLMVRVGGPNSLDLGEIIGLFDSEPSTSAGIGAVAGEVDQLALQVAVDVVPAARVAALERRIEDLARLVHSLNPVPADWEHPGRLGDKTPNSARVTTLNKITFTQPATPATFTLAGGKTFTVTNSIALAGVDGKTFTLSNTLGLSGTDGAFLNIGTGGTLGSAAYMDAATFVPRTGTVLAPQAYDLPSVITLANNFRNVMLSIGIGVDH